MMAEHTKLHLWLNSAIACGAFIASAASALFSWNSSQAKNESIVFSSKPSLECRVEFRKVGIGGRLGLCWQVTIANQSDSRTSLVSHQGFEVTKEGETFVSGFTEVEDKPGVTASFPIVLDAGEARSYLIRIPIDVPQSIVKVIENSEALSNNTATLSTVQYATDDAGLDFIGNSVQMTKFEDGKFTIQWPSEHRQALARMKFQTGRGNTFSVQLNFPPIP
jgi:hypothetical protein